jgi:PAS domain S-box-containing protein
MFDDTEMLNDRAGLVARFRRIALERTAGVLTDPAVIDDSTRKAEVFPRVAATLASSLEELRVLEEELQDQNSMLLAREKENRQRIDYERRLFDLAPTALLVTDMAGSIADANRSACTLVGCDSSALERKPLITFVPLEDRGEFRKQLERLGVAQGAADWRFRIAPRRDVPVLVSAAINVVARANRTCTGPGLFWCLRPVADG